MALKDPLQKDRPLFVKQPFTAAGIKYRKGNHFPWLKKEMDFDKVHKLYLQGFVHHNEVLEKNVDRFYAATIRDLHEYIKVVNQNVKEACQNDQEAKKYSIKFSQKKETQINLIKLHKKNWPEFHNGVDV